MAEKESAPRKGQVKPAKKVTAEVTPEKKPVSKPPPSLVPVSEAIAKQRPRNPRGW